MEENIRSCKRTTLFQLNERFLSDNFIGLKWNSHSKLHHRKFIDSCSINILKLFILLKKLYLKL